MSTGPNPRTTTALEDIARALSDQADAMVRSNALMAQWVKIHQDEFERRAVLDAVEIDRRTRWDATTEELRRLELELRRLDERPETPEVPPPC